MFFSVTKLFQSQDIGLRRFLYLMIKEISPSSDEVTGPAHYPATCTCSRTMLYDSQPSSLKIISPAMHSSGSGFSNADVAVFLCLQVIIVTSSLMKDLNSKTDLYRANAIRVLCRITDGGLLGQIERYLKQAVVDKNPVVASAALVSGMHLFQVRTSL